MRHQITELSARRAVLFTHQGAAMEECMVADAALWAILVVAIAFISCGCHFTRRPRKVAAESTDRALDRAA